MASTFAGRILLAGDVVDGFISIEAGRIVDAGQGEPPEPPTATGWLVPRMVNAHTHVGDAFLRNREGKPSTVKELVGPGGWKHRNLAAANDAEQEAGIQRYASEMASAGIGTFIDFREGGAAGIATLRRLRGLAAAPVIYGRPAKAGHDVQEAAAVLAASDGLGLPGLRDMPASDVASWVEAAHAVRKPVAIHFSEDHRDDVGALLALEPRFVVHALHCTDGDWEDLAQDDVAVVVAPRSNAYFGLKTPIPGMLDAGLTLAVGTDNGMLNDGNILADLAQLRTWYPDLETADLLRMATFAGRAILGSPPPTMPRTGQPADWVVLPEDPLAVAPRTKPKLGLAGGP